MAYEEPYGEKRPEDEAGEVGSEPDEDPEARARAERAQDRDEGVVERVKEKGEELLDKVSGPDVPPSLSDEEKRD